MEKLAKISNFIETGRPGSNPTDAGFTHDGGGMSCQEALVRARAAKATKKPALDIVGMIPTNRAPEDQKDN